MTVNQKELAACLGISARRVRQLKEDGLFQKPESEPGYNLEKCVQEYIDYKVNSETGRSQAISKEKVQAEHEEIKKQISLLKLRRLKRELHEASDVEYYLTDMLVRFRNRIMSLPTKIAMSISGEDMNHQIQIITDLLEGALEELSEYNPDDIEHGVEYDDALEDAEEDENEEEEDE